MRQRQQHQRACGSTLSTVDSRHVLHTQLSLQRRRRGLRQRCRRHSQRQRGAPVTSDNDHPRRVQPDGHQVVRRRVRLPLHREADLTAVQMQQTRSFNQRRVAPVDGSAVWNGDLRHAWSFADADAEAAVLPVLVDQLQRR